MADLTVSSPVDTLMQATDEQEMQEAIIPRMTTAERDALASPGDGYLIFNTTTSKLNFYNGAAWEVVTSA